MIVSTDNGFARLLVILGALALIGAVALFALDHASAAWVATYVGVAVIVPGLVKSVELRPRDAWDRKMRLEAILVAIASVAFGAFGVFWLVSDGANGLTVAIASFVEMALGLVFADWLWRIGSDRPDRLIFGRPSTRTPEDEPR